MEKRIDKATERALEAYPPKMRYVGIDSVKYDRKIDVNEPMRDRYVKAYHQAEKDLELGWEQIYSILYFEREVLREFGNEEHSNEEVCKEVLKRFKERKRQ